MALLGKGVIEELDQENKKLKGFLGIGGSPFFPSWVNISLWISF